MAERRALIEIREGIRKGILTALAHDFEMIGGRTARRLVAAGVVGIAGAVGATLLISGHPLGHHPPWHVVVFGTVWAGLLVVSLSLLFLQIRTPTLRIAPAAAVGVLGLGLAGIGSVYCPDQHLLDWWTATVPGASIMTAGGLLTAALCFGLLTSYVLGALAAFSVFRGRSDRAERILAAGALFLLLEPAVVLQSAGASIGTFAAWTLGTGIGGYAGIAGGASLRSISLRWDDGSRIASREEEEVSE